MGHCSAFSPAEYAWCVNSSATLNERSEQKHTPGLFAHKFIAERLQRAIGNTTNQVLRHELKLTYNFTLTCSCYQLTLLQQAQRTRTDHKNCNNQNIMALQKCSFKPNIRQRLHTSTWLIHTNGQKHHPGTIKELNRPSHTDIQKEPLKMYWLFRLEHAFSAACHPNWVNFPPLLPRFLSLFLSPSLSFSIPPTVSLSIPPFLLLESWKRYSLPGNICRATEQVHATRTLTALKIDTS